MKSLKIALFQKMSDLSSISKSIMNTQVIFSSKLVLINKMLIKVQNLSIFKKLPELLSNTSRTTMNSQVIRGYKVVLLNKVLK